MIETERYRKNQSAILRAFAEVGQTGVSQESGISETKLSRIKDSEVKMDLLSIAKLLAACGLKCVPTEMKCYKPETLQSLITLARERMKEIETPEQLLWEE